MKLYPDWLSLVLEKAGTGTPTEKYVEMFNRFTARLQGAVDNSQSAMMLLENEFPELDAGQINEMLGFYLKRKASQ